MNAFLKSSDWNTPVAAWGKCDDTMKSRDDGTGCADAPGYGSGLTWDPCTETVNAMQRSCGSLLARRGSF